MTRKIFLNTSYQLIAKFFSMAVTIFATILITRLYDKVSYGEFSIMQTLPALFYILADFGFNAVAVNKIIANPSLEQKFYSVVLATRLFLSLLFVLLVNMASTILPYSESLRSGIFITSFLIFTQALYATNNIIFQARQRYDLSALSSLAGSLVILALTLIFAYTKVPIMWVSFSYVLGGLMVFILGLFLFRQLNFKPSFSIELLEIRTLFIASLPLGLMFVFSQINFKADAILLSFLKLPSDLSTTNLEAVAVYGLAYKIFEVTLVIPTFFMNSIYPVFVHKFNQDSAEFVSFFRKSLKLLLVIGVVISVLGILFAPLAIRLLGGEDFESSISVLRVLSAQVFLFFLTQPLAYFLVMLNRQKILPLIYFLSSVINLSSNLVFIPVFGFYASAVITGICEAFILLMLLIVVKNSWRNYVRRNDDLAKAF